jgi:hypothetical protein
MTADGATSPFAQEALNGCLPRPYLPFGARRQGFSVARAIVVLGHGDRLCIEGQRAGQ